jgi:hypothetical protein
VPDGLDIRAGLALLAGPPAGGVLQPGPPARIFAGRGAPAPAAACTPAPGSAGPASIQTMSTTRAISDLAVMSAEPAVVKAVTLEYEASVRPAAG